MVTIAPEMKKCSVSPSGAILTAQGRAMFTAVAERFISKQKKAKNPAERGEYAVALIFPPDTDFSVLIDACKAKATEKYPAGIPAKFNWPVSKCKDVADNKGDKRYGAEFDDWFQIRANTFTQRPGIVGPDGQRLDTVREGETADDVTARIKEQVYTGAWLRVSVAPSAYDTDGNRGVKLYLNNVQKLADDEKLGGSGSGAAAPEDDFGAPVAAASGGEPAKATTTDSLFG